MSMQTIIPAGFRLTVHSWENDGDNRRSLVQDGLTSAHARFLVDFAKLFYSRNNRRGTAGFGNLYKPSSEELQQAHDAAKQVFLKHWDEFVSLYEGITKEELEDPESDALHDIVGELHYDLFGASEFRFRVLDKYTVEFVPEVIELEDVTSAFP